MAMANSEGSEVMLNRVMTKDNIGVAVLLEVKKELFTGGEHVAYGLLFCVAVWLFLTLRAMQDLYKLNQIIIELYTH